MHHLCTFFILPLCGLNYLDFGDNFINCYLSGEYEVIVEVKKNYKEYWDHEQFVSSIGSNDGNTFLLYAIPRQFDEEYRLYQEGKYSQFSEIAKEKIIKGSGLIYKKRTREGTYRTAIQLLGLLKHPAYKEILEDQLGVTLSDSAELLSKPDLSIELIEL